jgi:hypothetical protein
MPETPLWARLAYIRGRTVAKTLLRLCGIGLVLLGAFNMFAAPALDVAAVAPYRAFGLVDAARDGTVFYLGDVLVMGVGAAVAWFV